MDRRSFLRCAAFGVVPGTVGCLGRRAPVSRGSSVGNVETSYPRLSAASYDVDAEPLEPGDSLVNVGGGPISFEELSAANRVEVANAIHRGLYWTDDSGLVSADRHNAVVTYRGSRFALGVGVADRWSTEHGPGNDLDWTDPVDLAVDVAGGELRVALTNELDVDLPVYHFGRPYFGVLVAVAGTTVVLDHDHYEENDLVRTSGIVTTGDVREADRRRAALAPGESLDESYALPDRLPAESKVHVSAWLGGDSIEQFPNPRTVLNGTFTLER